MGLTGDEQKLLKRLQRKAEEPDPTPASRSLSISLDLADDKQIDKARKLGLLDWIRGDDDDDTSGDDDTGDDDDPDPEDTPRRRSYFKD